MQFHHLVILINNFDNKNIYIVINIIMHSIVDGSISIIQDPHKVQYEFTTLTYIHVIVGMYMKA